MVGLLGNFHPPSALFLTVVLLALLLWQRWREASGWIAVGACGVAALVGIN